MAVRFSPMRSRHLRLSFAIVLIFVCSRTSFGREATVSPKVDPRVELLSIVFRLAGNSEYNMSPLKIYTADIDAYFSSYKEHAAVVLALRLAHEKDVGFDAVMSQAVHLSSPPALKPLVAFTDEVPDSRFGKDNAVLFAQRLADFYRDTHFERFFTAHQALYHLAEDRFWVVLADLDLNWYKTFYGDVRIGQYHLILGMNNGGGNYGPMLFCLMVKKNFSPLSDAGPKMILGIRPTARKRITSLPSSTSSTTLS